MTLLHPFGIVLFFLFLFFHLKLSLFFFFCSLLFFSLPCFFLHLLLTLQDTPTHTHTHTHTHSLSLLQRGASFTHFFLVFLQHSPVVIIAFVFLCRRRTGTIHRRRRCTMQRTSGPPPVQFFLEAKKRSPQSLCTHLYHLLSFSFRLFCVRTLFFGLLFFFFFVSENPRM